VVAAVVVVLEVAAARGGEWCGGSYRSGEGECFRVSPEKFSAGGGDRRLAGGGRWPENMEWVHILL
nr:hypothetical protein [Tanacetum cinerariifolium]GEZ53536.1 hypothetical protein [Tanacetum cinerariifolium]